MSSTSVSQVNPYPPLDSAVDPRRRLFQGLVSIVVLIAIAVIIGVGFSLAQGQFPSWSGALAAWSWVVTVILVILAVVIVIGVVRLVVMGVRGEPYSRHHERRFDRRREADESAQGPSAVEIARQRFARGEISEDQYDQILQKLAKGSEAPSPR